MTVCFSRDQSLKLARTLAPEQIPFISRAYAQQLEFKGEHSLALQMYEKGLMDERKAAQYYARIESGEEADVAAFADVDVEEHNRLAQ